MHLSYFQAVFQLAGCMPAQGKTTASHLRYHQPACVLICSRVLAGSLPAGRLHAHHVCVLQPGALGAPVERRRRAEPVSADFQPVGSPCQGSASRSVIALRPSSNLMIASPHDTRAWISISVPVRSVFISVLCCLD